MNTTQQRLRTWRERCLEQIGNVSPLKTFGRVREVNGILVKSSLPGATIGELCKIALHDGKHVLAEVIGFNQQEAVLSALGGIEGVQLGNLVEPLGHAHRVSVSDALLGTVLDGFGRPLDGNGVSAFATRAAKSSVDVINAVQVPSSRPRITEKLLTGIRALDGPLTLGKGQRVGIFAGAGCGKTTLIAEIARNVDCDVIVFGMVGERGRELREFLDYELDEALRAKSIVVCATSDRSSMERSRAAFTATAIAEDFRRRGKHVLLLIDSLTRYARAQREIGLAAGEPLGRGGLPPSVYSMLPRLLERAGLDSNGAISAIYTVLIEQDSMNDPVADEVRSLIDGHIVLSRKLADQGHYPAINVLGSLSRTQSNVADDAHLTVAYRLRQLLSAYEDVELMVKLGEYRPGHQPLTDLAVNSRSDVMAFLRQASRAPSPLENTLHQLSELTANVQ
ncbi:Type III secretion ATP synthase HrcN [Halomonadaceae bacterium LMG 33818]|uniref:FliI/YscN family ATPase n=1 Tax=Cernens ardua TaxID=3402176 RepID=UPI003EDCA76D